jgi:CRP-like cAMP-binding protein
VKDSDDQEDDGNQEGEREGEGGEEESGQDADKQEDDEGERETIILLGAKTMIGELTFASGTRRHSASCRASMTVVGHEIEHSALRALCEKDLVLGYKVMRNIARICAVRLERTLKINSDTVAALQMCAKKRNTAVAFN